MYISLLAGGWSAQTSAETLSQNNDDDDDDDDVTKASSEWYCAHKIGHLAPNLPTLHQVPTPTLTTKYIYINHLNHLREVRPWNSCQQHPWPMAFLPPPPLYWCRLSQLSHSPKWLTDISGCLFFYVYFLQPEEIPSLSTFAPVFVVCWERFEIGAVKKWYTEAIWYRLMPFKCCYKERSALKKEVKGQDQ